MGNRDVDMIEYILEYHKAYQAEKPWHRQCVRRERNPETVRGWMNKDQAKKQTVINQWKD